MLCIIARVTRYSDRFGHLRVDEVSMLPSTPSVDEARPFELSNELSHLRWH